MDSRMLFGGKVVISGGNFRQTLPIVRNGKKEDFISQILLYSEIWNHLKKLHLSENMRARIDPAFSEYLMRIGDGKETLNSDNKVEFPTSHVILTTKNDYVHDINDMLISKFPNTARSFIAIYEIVEPNDQSLFEDYLHTLNPANLPPYKLTLK
ncbi:hypothetical protein H5410_046624 [Solanum commersonii]|uniref:ATP-dependent DNA helicase n=1 Tax=Solanum commersonii TaxID=4109 RepID=A0A9J5XG88_SOLCO|nr:hypothetical protein H5410_046624 [Solanum commersonii]